MLNRRQFGMAAAATSLWVASGCSSEQKSSQDYAPQKGTRSVSKVGIQTYTLRAMMAEKPKKTFRMIKEAGYDFVELNGRDFEWVKLTRLQSILDEFQLSAPASHISIDAIRGDLDSLLVNAHALNMKYLIVPYIAEDQRSFEDWKAHAALMNEKGAILASEGITLAYHNHQFEFDDLGGGTTAMDIILGDCAPENLAMEIDFFWAYLADADIGKLFKDNPGRFKLCHIKDMGPNKADFAGADYETMTSKLMLNVGEGVIPFEDYLAMNDLSGMEYFVAEHDNPKQPYADAIKTSHDAIRAFRF